MCRSTGESRSVARTSHPDPLPRVSAQAILENQAVQKLLYDVRCDSDALYHQYGVRLGGVMDLQIAGV